MSKAEHIVMQQRVCLAFPYLTGTGCWAVRLYGHIWAVPYGILIQPLASLGSNVDDLPRLRYSITLSRDLSSPPPLMTRNDRSNSMASRQHLLYIWTSSSCTLLPLTTLPSVDVNSYKRMYVGEVPFVFRIIHSMTGHLVSLNPRKHRHSH